MTEKNKASININKNILAIKRFILSEIIMILLGILLNYETVMLSYAFISGYTSGFIEGISK